MDFCAIGRLSSQRLIGALGCALLLATQPACSTALDDDDSALPEPDAEHLFDFVIIADPHIAGSISHEDRLRSAVSWVNEHREEYGIELSLILGDIGWGAGLVPSRELLDGLSVPYVPVIGDNVVVSGGEQGFEETFSSTWDALAGELSAWEKAALPVWHDAAARDTWLSNTRFEHGGLLFISQDWNVRDTTGIMAEFGELNDVEGGSWEWLDAALEGVEERPDESVILLSHVPMAPVAFDLEERERFASRIAPVKTKVFANFAGHLHVNYEEHFLDAGYSTYVTDATWDDEITLRRVSVYGDGERMSYEQELVVVE